jgi:outer membrane protein
LKLSRLVCALALPVLLASSAAHADTKFAYVDLQRAIQETDEGRAAKDKLQATLQAKQKEIDAAQEELRKEKETLDKQASAMSDDVRTQKATALQKKFMDLAQRFEKERGEMQQAQQQALASLFDKMNPIIADIAQQEGIAMVFEKHDSGLVYAPPSLDITNELVRRYNGKYKSAGGTAKTTTPKK